jgi:hypothetical protein
MRFHVRCTAPGFQQETIKLPSSYAAFIENHVCHYESVRKKWRTRVATIGRRQYMCRTGRAGTWVPWVPKS